VINNGCGDGSCNLDRLCEILKQRCRGIGEGARCGERETTVRRGRDTE